MPVVDSWPLFGLNADFFAMSLDCDSGTNILRMHHVTDWNHYPICNEFTRLILKLIKLTLKSPNCILSVSVDNPPPCNDSLIPLVVGPRHTRHRGAGHQLHCCEQDRPRWGVLELSLSRISGPQASLIIDGGLHYPPALCCVGDENITTTPEIPIPEGDCKGYFS